MTKEKVVIDIPRIDLPTIDIPKIELTKDYVLYVGGTVLLVGVVVAFYLESRRIKKLSKKLDLIIG